MAMREIQLQYKKWFRTKTLRYPIPTEYCEMSPNQFLATVRLSKGWINEEEFYLQFFNLSKDILSKLDSFQVYKLTTMLEFLRNARSPHKEFYVSSLPGCLLAPAPLLSSMCFQQFMTVDTFFSYYIATDKAIYLDRFIAALYLKKHEAYLPKPGEFGLNLDTRILEVSKIPFDLKYSILINWVLIKTWLSISYPHLFPNAPGEENTQGDKIKSKPVDWLPLFDQLVGDNLSQIDEYKAIHCMDAFRIINRKIKEAQK